MIELLDAEGERRLRKGFHHLEEPANFCLKRVVRKIQKRMLMKIQKTSLKVLQLLNSEAQC